MERDAHEGIRSKKSVTVEESKYLGGDIEHTHLVKGLDYALLNRRRKEIQKTDPKEAKGETNGDATQSLAAAAGMEAMDVEDSSKSQRCVLVSAVQPGCSLLNCPEIHPQRHF